MAYLWFAVYITRLSLQCGHVQWCDMSVANSLITSIHNCTIYVDMVNVLQNQRICVLKDIVDETQPLDNNLTSFIM